MRPYIAFALAVAIHAGIGYALWIDHATNVEPAKTPQNENAPAPPEAAMATTEKRQSVPRMAGGVFKCGSNYQDLPCKDGDSAEIDGGTLTVVSPPPVILDHRRHQPDGPHFGRIARQDEKQDTMACDSLREQLKRIDAAARIRSTEYLNERRREVKRQLSDLYCSEIG